jgi:Zn-dependent M16 (insulinase) family peptidase
MTIYQTLVACAVLCFMVISGQAQTAPAENELSHFSEGQRIAGLRVNNLYSDPEGKIVGTKLVDIRSATPIFLLQVQTVPKAFIWVDTPDYSNRGVPHALEHLLAAKGTKGRFVTLLTNMRLSVSVAATEKDFNYYSYSSGTGMVGFFEQLHAWLGALFRADFTNVEAERELYHFGASIDPDKMIRLFEGGSVYDEKQTRQGNETYYFELNRRILGDTNPLSADIRGAPDSMRSTSSQDIRTFYSQHYQLGPSTGLIFVIDPKENVTEFLNRVSQELAPFTLVSHPSTSAGTGVKYPVHSSPENLVGIYPFPSGGDSDAAAVRLGWKPAKIQRETELRLLQLLFRSFASDQKSVLYRSMIDSATRDADFGASKVDYDVFIANSPFAPWAEVELSGIPGNKISVQLIEKIQNFVSGKLREIAAYQDGSKELRDFNKLVLSDAQDWRRNQTVWIKTPPLFGIDLDAEWKDHLETLELNRSFVRSLSSEPAWQEILGQLQSGKNIWRNVIAKSNLIDKPYATASQPSPQILESMERSKNERFKKKIEELRDQYSAIDDQTALTRFNQAELAKSREIDRIEAKVARPRFTEHPPLTADDEIRYRKFHLGNVPVTASIFERPPTSDIGFAFDIRAIPPKYYRYLPILPRAFDSMGIKRGQSLVSYSDLMEKIHENTTQYTVGYEQNAVSGRVDLVFRLSSIDLAGLNGALELTSELMHSSYLEAATLDRLRDLTAQRLRKDYAYKGNEFIWMQNAAYSFLTQQDAVFQAVNSSFTRTHWDERLNWQLHAPVETSEIESLAPFAAKILSSSEISSSQISRERENAALRPLQRELLEYWSRNVSFFPQEELAAGLRRLTAEVQDDLRKGPNKTVEEIKELQKIVLTQQALHIDVVADETTLTGITPRITGLIESLPANSISERPDLTKKNEGWPIMSKLAQRYHLSRQDFPWYVGLVNQDGTSGDMVFYSDLPGYSQLDRSSLLKILASKVFSDDGPDSFFIKTREAGLAYAILLTSDPAFKLLWNYADRSPDVPGLVNLLNNLTKDVSHLEDPVMIDYALHETFAVPRTIYPPSVRGVALAQDLRDGNDPETVRRFSEAILELRRDPDLAKEIKAAAFNSICGILLTAQCIPQQKADHSIFFFVGPEAVLTDAEKRIPTPKLLRLWPSDYWVQ